MPCSFSVEGGVIIDRSRLVPDPEPVRKVRKKEKVVNDPQGEDGARAGRAGRTKQQGK